MNKYKLEKSKDLPGWWVFTDVENLIVIKFEDGKFNETQQVSFIDDNAADLGASNLARIMREMGDYISRYHADIAFRDTYGLVCDADENVYLYRRLNPKWRIKLDEDIDLHDFGISLKKAGEFILKRLCH